MEVHYIWAHCIQQWWETSGQRWGLCGKVWAVITLLEKRSIRVLIFSWVKAQHQHQDRTIDIISQLWVWLITTFQVNWGWTKLMEGNRELVAWMWILMRRFKLLVWSLVLPSCWSLKISNEQFTSSHITTSLFSHFHTLSADLKQIHMQGVLPSWLTLLVLANIIIGEGIHPI